LVKAARILRLPQIRHLLVAVGDCGEEAKTVLLASHRIAALLHIFDLPDYQVLTVLSLPSQWECAEFYIIFRY